MKLFHSVVLIGLVFLLMACGSRKSELQLSVEKMDVGIKETGNYSLQAELLCNTMINTFDDGFTLTPVNPDEPMEYTDVNGKKTTVKNGVLEKRSKKQTEVTREKEYKKESANYVSEIKATSYKKDKEKKTKRKPMPVTYILIGGSVIVLLYFFIAWLRRNKDKITI